MPPSANCDLYFQQSSDETAGGCVGFDDVTLCWERASDLRNRTHGNISVFV
jgi:hypothetical protein